MAIPKDVRLDGISASFLSGLNERRPHSGDATRIVNGGGDDELSLAIDEE